MKYNNLIYKFFDSKPTILYLLIFLLFGLVRLVMLQWDPIGLPDDHDEYSNLLQAETFAQGRFSNPAHPFYQHFESFHILQTPTYASKYPPGQAFFLFLGIKLFGHPWYGVLLSCMIMASCLVWMINGYCSTRWAFWAGIFIVFRFALWNYWSSSYWGGAVAAIGGALVFGALPRLRSNQKIELGIASFCLGLGLAILSQSRPFEGVVVSLIPMLYFIKLVFQALKNKKYSRAAVVALPIGIVLFLNFSFIAIYNYQITGNYLKTPYQLHGEQYGVQAPLLILNNKEEIPAYNHIIFSKHYNGWEVVDINTAKDYLSKKRQHFRKFIRFFYYWPFIVALTFFFIYSEPIKIPWWSFLLFCTIILIYPWFGPHYIGPILAVYYLLLIQGSRYLISHKNSIVRTLARVGLPLFLVITIVDSKHFATKHPSYINGTQQYVFRKQEILEELGQTSGKHLIFVKYTDDHKAEEEWVYNGPNLNQSKIIWARYMSTKKNLDLKKYYKERKTWLVQPDLENVGLEDY